jgi:hypothetical protein
LAENTLCQSAKCKNFTLTPISNNNFDISHRYNPPSEKLNFYEFKQSLTLGTAFADVRRKLKNERE